MTRERVKVCRCDVPECGKPPCGHCPADGGRHASSTCFVLTERHCPPAPCSAPPGTSALFGEGHTTLISALSVASPQSWCTGAVRNPHVARRCAVSTATLCHGPERTLSPAALREGLGVPRVKTFAGRHCGAERFCAPSAPATCGQCDEARNVTLCCLSIRSR